MSRELEWTKRAAADLSRIDRTTRERIRQAVYRLATTGHGDVKHLRGTPDTFRLRVGSWRVRFTIDHASGALRILRVLPRGSAYRD